MPQLSPSMAFLMFMLILFTLLILTMKMSYSGMPLKKSKSSAKKLIKNYFF